MSLRQFAPGASRFLGRASEFPSEAAAVAAAIAKDADALRKANGHMDDLWRSNGGSNLRSYDTIIIGGGIHGVTYALNTETDGPVLLLEPGYIGGTFARPYGRAFYLNSRNRRGENSIPGTSGALNFIPGSDVQPRDVGGQEYQDNWDLAFAIRCAAMNANIEICPDKVYEIKDNRVFLAEYVVTADRIIVATGLGRSPSFQQFLNRIARLPFPLRGKKRVAVLGAGDSGKVTVEALLGQTPFVDTTLDEVERIDWFGQQSFTKEDFEQCERSRYAGIARFFPRRDDDVFFKISPYSFKAQKRGKYVVHDGTYYGPYDAIIECTGFKQEDLVGVQGPQLVPVRRNNMTVAMQYGDWPVYKVGPCANIPVEPFEVEALAGIPANSAAIFRYAPRTAMFAKEG